MAQRRDAQETQEFAKHPVMSTMFYGSLFVYVLIVLLAIGWLIVR